MKKNLKQAVFSLLELRERLLTLRRLRNMDQNYPLNFENSGTHPPSFYYLHSKEEVRRATIEDQKRVQEMADRLKELVEQYRKDS